MANIVSDTPYCITTELAAVLSKFAFHPVLIKDVSERERPAVIVLASSGLLAHYWDERRQFGYQITPAGLQGLER